mmetsp:Transcript_8201/g.24174  ORF Transcript_8201/g.24174 Transcript_8201/m.24174 type:complete len:148 (-) Transcript_8201:71-514(-)
MIGLQRQLLGQRAKGPSECSNCGMGAIVCGYLDSAAAALGAAQTRVWREAVCIAFNVVSQSLWCGGGSPAPESNLAYRWTRDGAAPNIPAQSCVECCGSFSRLLLLRTFVSLRVAVGTAQPHRTFGIALGGNDCAGTGCCAILTKNA